MFSYYEKGFKSKKIDKVISTEELIQHIKNHPSKSKIGRLRASKYKSQNYIEIKETLPCITPAGIFMESRTPECLLQLSGYLFFDLDFPQRALEDIKQQILKQYRPYISLLGVSVGGKGLFFYVKVNNLSKDNYTAIYEYLRTQVFTSLDIDNNAKGINRAHIIPYDENVYFNPDTSIEISEELQNRKLKKETFNIKDNKRGCYTSNVSFLPIDEVWKSIRTETEIQVNDAVFLIEPVDYLKLFIPKKIKDGRKHATFRGITMALMFLNPGIDLLTLQSFVNYVNYNHTTVPMKEREMMRTVQDCYSKVQETGEINLALGIKRLHFNRNAQLTATEKRRLANVINGKIRSLLSVLQIQKAIETLKENGQKTTRNNVAKVSELSLKTVSRNWNNNPADILNQINRLNTSM